MTDAERCRSEIAACEAYTGPDGLGILMAWADWCIELDFVMRDEKEITG